MSLLSELFTWWNGATLSTRLYTASRGTLVGEDECGNRYYADKGKARDAASNGPAGQPRRWVIYRGTADASKVPAEWYGWLHYIVDTPPGSEPYLSKPWQRPHLANMTGTGAAYRPQGSLLGEAKRPHADGDYQPWNPE